MKSLRMYFLSLAVAMTIPSTGCSIVMALNGHPEPNFDNIKVGATREIVEFEFGQPISSVQQEDGRYQSTYQYQMGNSSNSARASIYTLYDIYTLGLAEPIFTLIELFQGRDEQTLITYGPDNKVTQITGYTPPPPSPSLKASMEQQEQWVRKPPKSRAEETETRTAISGISTDPSPSEQRSTSIDP